MRHDARGQGSGLITDALSRLRQALSDIRRESNLAGSLRADHLSRLNSAALSLSGQGAVDGALALRVFTAEKIHNAHHVGKYDNTIFFSRKQNEKFVSWIKLWFCARAAKTSPPKFKFSVASINLRRCW